MRPAMSFAGSIILLTTILTCSAFGQSGWKKMRSPNPGADTNFLYDVSASSSVDAWAVGVYYSSGNSPNTLTEHWDGTAWTFVSSPSCVGSWAQFSSVATISTTDAWAVGYYCGTHPLVAHWDGSQWTQVPVPAPDHALASVLYSVDAISSNDVWAVGAYQIYSGQPNITLVEHWDGASWKIIPSPSPGRPYGEGALNAVTAIAANDVWAVGWTVNQSLEIVLIEHWDGTQWTVVRGTNPGDWYNYLDGIVALSANDIWAVGGYQNSLGSISSALVEHWDGTRWQQIQSPTITLGNHPVLTSLAPISSADVWASGFIEGSNTLEPLTQHWDGTRWRIVPTPLVGIDAQLMGMAVAGGKIWSVGAYSKTGFTYGGGLKDPLTLILGK